MGPRVGDLDGGILGLYRLLSEHGEAIAYDLFVAGKHIDWLGTRRLSWLDLLIFVKHSPQTSALSRAVNGEGALWTPETYLLALVVDALNSANWQRAQGRGGPRPKPVPRPGDRQVGMKIRATPVDLDELDAQLGYSARAQ